MNIKDTVYEDTIGIEFSPDDFHAMNLSPRAVIDSSGGTCVLVPTETAIALRDRLNEFFPPEPDEPESGLPEEPEGPGYYITQQNLLLAKDEDGDWSIFGEFSQWENDERYTDDWHVVYKTLGAEAFPLTKLNTKKEH
ncbi:MAG: hypothetical protein KHW71_03150 [Bifidobacterium dentium]|nr:hypothetical protein [Bifidobacterium dentium]